MGMGKISILFCLINHNIFLQLQQWEYRNKDNYEKQIKYYSNIEMIYLIKINHKETINDSHRSLQWCIDCVSVHVCSLRIPLYV